MAYRKKGLKKTNDFKVRLSDDEQSLVDRAVDIDGGQRAVLAREIILNWAKNTIANALPHQIARQNFGVVDPDGEIKYRFA